MKKQFNKEKEYLFISITSGSINPASSINIFFSILPLPPPLPNLSFLHLSFFELSRPTFNLSSFHNLSYPISSFPISLRHSIHTSSIAILIDFQFLCSFPQPIPPPPPSLFLSQHTTSPPFLPRIPFISTSSSQSITPRRLLSSAFLPHTRPTSSPISLTSRPPLLPFQFSLHLSRHRLSGSFSNAPP